MQSQKELFVWSSQVKFCIPFVLIVTLLTYMWNNKKLCNQFSKPIILSLKQQIQ